jgi:hypothetical protein
MNDVPVSLRKWGAGGRGGYGLRNDHIQVFYLSLGLSFHNKTNKSSLYLSLYRFKRQLIRNPISLLSWPVPSWMRWVQCFRCLTSVSDMKDSRVVLTLVLMDTQITLTIYIGHLMRLSMTRLENISLTIITIPLTLSPSDYFEYRQSKTHQIPSIMDCLELTDRYPLEVESKFGFITWKPRGIVFTINYDPKEWWTTESVVSVETFMCRVTKCEHII